MKIGRAHAIALRGFTTIAVTVEAALMRGMPGMNIVGLPDAAVNESRERIRAAFQAAGITFPSVRVMVNLSPAHVQKSGTGFDLAIAAAIFSAMSGVYKPRTFFIGELGLDGSVRAVNGILAALWGISRESEHEESAEQTHFVVPYPAREQAKLVSENIEASWHISHIAHMYGIASSPAPGAPPIHAREKEAEEPHIDYGEVFGQEEAKFIMMVAAVGGHHVLMMGSPGAGKSMIARRFPAILPELSRDEAIEVAALASLENKDVEIQNIPPFIAPHHSTSSSALIGGGSVPRPGAITRAHRGVLFLDEVPEFRLDALQALREPIEVGLVHIHRARAVTTYPSQFHLIAAANPCRCGNFLEPTRSCTCSPRSRRAYQEKIGGPLKDRIDVHILLRQPDKALSYQRGMNTHDMKEKVLEARQRAQHRLKDTPWQKNAQVAGSWLRSNGLPHQGAINLLEEAVKAGRISMRSVDKVLALSWSLADISGSDRPEAFHLHQALALRAFDAMSMSE